MIEVFRHPSSRDLLIRVTEIFNSKQIYQKRDRHIVFLCGGSLETHAQSMRRRFLDHARDKLSDFHFFIAEAATNDITSFEPPQFIDLTEFETLLAGVSDCLIIFVESPGAIAELGFFSNSDAASKILIVNDINKQNRSFITSGPIHLIDGESSFRYALYIDFSSSRHFNLIERRLRDVLRRKTSTRLKMPRMFKTFSPHEKLHIVYGIVDIFRSLTADDVIYAINKIFRGVGSREKKDVKHLLSILAASDYLKRSGPDNAYLSPANDNNYFLDFHGIDINDIRADAIDHLRRHHRDALQQVQSGAS
jgi:hypothetical protein